MLNKKNLFVLAVIINIIITFFSSVNVGADDAPAGDEYATIANSLPDALIILDLSGSMTSNPSEMYPSVHPYGYDTSCLANTTACNNPDDVYYYYSYDATCTADAVNCPGSNDATHTYIYGHDSTCSANDAAGACIGTGSTYYFYAHDSSCTASSTYCKSSYSDCNGSFCHGSSHSNCKTNCSNSSGKYGYCSGGFCGVSKTGCSTNCNCKDGMCHTSRTNCANQCATNHCTDGFCSDHAQTDCQTNCSKLDIAKRALFSLLDDNKDDIINAADMNSMGIRIGFMRFKAGDDTSGNYASGNIFLVDVISAITGGVSSNNQTSYSLTYCGNSTSCTSTSTCSTGECIANETASAGTPLASALKEAKTYLDAHKAGDAYKGCRPKFVILVTDGDDTFACGGSGGECQSEMYARRREVVAATKQLADAGYKVFVVGFGSAMPTYLKNTLNWMAWYGGEDNPFPDPITGLGNQGSVTAYNIPLGCNDIVPVTSACCNLSTNATACFPSGITSGQTDSSTITNDDCGSSQSGFRATYNDPGYIDLSGYAFLAGDASSLASSLKSAFDTIREATYSFTHASIQAQRTTDENYLYEASFEPLATDPLWIGHLKRFSLNTDGSIPGASDWDAGAVLKAVAEDGVSSPRNIYTYTTNGTTSGLNTFTAGYLSDANLVTTTDNDRNNIIKFIRRGDSGYTTGTAFYRWKLGDILHTSPLTIPTPNYNFYDTVDQTSYDQCYDPTTQACVSCSYGKAFNQFLCSHIRKTTIGNRIILIGANDGQVHAFKTSNGSEAWSFIPPNLLTRLSLISHSSHPTDESHRYFVDGPLAAAEVWVPSAGYTSATSAIGSTAKSYSDWRTYLVMSEGRGGISTLWSSSPTCACSISATDCSAVFSSSYSSTYNNYCGYYALDLTETTSTAPAIPPAFKWHLGGTSGLSSSTSSYDQPAFLGQPWSKMFFGRVRINNNETWVGLLGGGYSGTDCAGTTTCSDKRGKAFYVVDVSNGHILWSFTHDGSGNAGNVKMDYNLAAGPVGIDTDNDGFIDTAYVGDLGGNVWRFKFCLQSQGTSCNVSSWTGGLLLNNH